MTLNKEALEKARAAMLAEITDTWHDGHPMIGPATADRMVEAAITAYLASLPSHGKRPDLVELIGKLEKMASAAHESSRFYSALDQAFLSERERDRACILDIAVYEIRAAATALRMQDGWVLVPREPTKAMVKAARDAKIFLNMTDAGWIRAYKAMLSAAPTGDTTGDDRG